MKIAILKDNCMAVDNENEKWIYLLNASNQLAVVTINIIYLATVYLKQ